MNYGKRKLESLYSEVAGRPVMPRRHLKVLGEDIDLYTKGEEGYAHIGSVGDNDFKKVQKMTGGDHIGQIVSYLNDKNYNEKSFQNKHDFNSLVSMLDSYDFDEYIKSSQKPSLEKEREGNIFNITNTIGLDERGARAIAQFKPVDAGGSNVGPGEVLLALIFKDVANASEGGDLKLGGESLEVKGQGGRFGQQAGRGGVDFSLQYMIDVLGENIVLPRVSLSHSIATLHSAYSAAGIEQKFIPALTEALKSAYPNADFRYLNNVDYTDVSTRGSIRAALLKISLTNYTTRYNYNNILFIDKRLLDYAMFSKDDALKDGGLIDQGKLVSGNVTTKDLYPNNYYKF
jgi:hypothetical protein